MAEFGSRLEGIDTMTAVTALAEPPLVLVVLLVTIEAGALAKLVVAICMARHAGNGLVLALERVSVVSETLAARRIEMQKR